MSGIWSFVVVDVDAGVSVADMQKYAAAQQRQVVEHWFPYWGSIGTVRVASRDFPVRADEIQIQLLDKPTMDGALGFHDESKSGIPIIYVFVGLARQFGDAWTSIASHEVLETLGDPYLRKSVQMTDGFWDLEVADRVEGDSYEIDGVKLSNFNTPQCFEPPPDLTNVKYDWLGLSTKANEVRPGGYEQHFDPKEGWVMTTNGEKSAYRTKLAELGLSRGARRATRQS